MNPFWALQRRVNVHGAISRQSHLLLICLIACSGSDQRGQVAPPSAGKSHVAISPQQVAREAMASVVVLTTQDAHGQAWALGTGFFVAPGVVATNAHVVDLKPGN
jgi:S1-C subfamily serine protease